MNVWGITHRGVVREQNQDSYAWQRLPDGRIIALVCDGMGGARAGNVASTMATELFMEQFDPNVPASDADLARMERAAACANEAIFHRSIHDEACSGMGTTLVAVLTGEREALILNEGDSRAYYVAPEGIVRITRDHSLVEDLVERGELTEEQARIHPHKNLITRALGSEPTLRCDSFRRKLDPGSYLLLCSDGLSNLVSDQEILYEVIHGEDDASCCHRLLDIALHRGAPDNVTAVLIQV